MVMVFLLIGSVACSIPYIRAASCTKANGHDAVLGLHTRDIVFLGSHTLTLKLGDIALDLRCGVTQEKCHRGGAFACKSIVLHENQRITASLFLRGLVMLSM